MDEQNTVMQSGQDMNLPQTDFPLRANPAESEPALARRWATLETTAVGPSSPLPAPARCNP